MYFTDTPELRKFEREMRQKPNFDRRSDECDENEISHFSDNKNVNTNRKKKEVDFMTIKIRSPTNGYCLNQN
jgi:hypothetical protein